jgi:hypothetical protein
MRGFLSIFFFFLGEDRATPLWIQGHTSRVQGHSAPARDAVGSSEALHICARCTRNKLTISQHTKLRNLLS